MYPDLTRSLSLMVALLPCHSVHCCSPLLGLLYWLDLGPRELCMGDTGQGKQVEVFQASALGQVLLQCLEKANSFSFKPHNTFFCARKGGCQEPREPAQALRLSHQQCQRLVWSSLVQVRLHTLCLPALPLQHYSWSIPLFFHKVLLASASPSLMDQSSEGTEGLCFFATLCEYVQASRVIMTVGLG